MRMKVKIRQVKEEDIHQICKIEEASFKSDAYPPFYIRFLATFHRETFLVAEVGGRIAGYAVASIERWKLGRLVSIAVSPDCRRRGIGTSLLLELIRRLSKLGARKICLEVKKSNSTAQRMYEKLGFKADGTISAYYEDGEDAIVMVKELIGK